MDFKALEYRYFVSHDANVEVQCEISRLELPLSVHPDASTGATASSSSSSSSLRGGEGSTDSDKDEGTTDGEGGGASSSPLVLSQKEEVFVTVYLSCNGEALHGVPISTHTPSRYDVDKNWIIWNDLLTFDGVKYRDLSLDAQIVFTVWGIDHVPLGGTTIDLFDEHGVLCMGKQKLVFYFQVKGDSTIEDCQTPGSSAYHQEFASEDYRFRIEKARERYTFNQVPQVDWLDRISLPYTGRILSELSSSNNPRSHWSQRPFQSTEEQALIEHGFLIINLPMFQYPVLYEEKPYPGVGLPIGFQMNKALAGGGGGGDEKGAKAAEVLNPSLGWDLCMIYDCEAEADNPVESKYRKLAHDKFRGTSMDPNLKPNKEERERIDSMVNSPSDHLRIEDKDLLWTFRFSLTDNRKALIKFLLSVDWSVEQEVQQVPTLLEQWKQKTTIDLSDALKLLGREKAFQHEIVRTFAVDTLRRASDDEILNYLLQLVQALRYETTGSSADGEGEMMMTNDGGGGEGEEEEVRSLILARFLIERACGSLELANFLYWYLRVELEDSSSGEVFKAVFDDFCRTLREINPILFDLLRKQDVYIARLALAQRKARDDKGRKDQKEEKLRKLLSENQAMALPSNTEYLPLPLDPKIQIAGIVPSSAFMFKSALYPAVIQFKVYQGGSSSRTSPTAASSEDGGSGQRRLSRGNSKDQIPPPSRSYPITSYKVIFKNGDDLRQDQLIIQMVSLMDSLLKRINLDLKLKPYRILATGPRDGLMEFVSGSLAVSEVLNKYTTIHDYFRAHHPDATAPFGVATEVINTFVKSCAGYCVITYILGIGDRHLDNIMLLPEGNLFHIDFGFIFGNDPKPMPPPFRLAPQMVDAMGGEGHENYHRFKRYCCQAYNCFRENANLILTLLNLMVDAGIKDLSADPQTVLGKVEEKFRLDLNIEQAEVFFVSLISESLNAILPEIMERFHKMRTAIR